MGPHAALAGGVGPQPRVQNGVGDDWLPRFSNGTNFAYFCSHCPTLGGERREETFSQEPMGRACRARPVRPKEAYDAARIGLHRGRDGAGRHGRPRRRHGHAVARLETRGSVERDRAAAEGADRASLTASHARANTHPPREAPTGVEPRRAACGELTIAHVWRRPPRVPARRRTHSVCPLE